MFEIRWIQNDSTIIKRQLPDALGSTECVVSTAGRDLLYCIAYNEDSQLVNLDFRAVTQVGLKSGRKPSFILP